jgi:thioredoxin 1
VSGTVTDATFADDVLAAPVPVLVDFWAPWCKPCEAVEPHLRTLAEEHGERLRLVRMNVDENLVVPGRLGVLALPTVILFAGGEERARVVGAQPRLRYEEALAGWL